jgi:hypothetical protein
LTQSNPLAAERHKGHHSRTTPTLRLPASNMAIVTFTMNPAIDVSAAVTRVMPRHKLRCS